MRAQRRQVLFAEAGFTPRQLFSALQGAWLEPVVRNIWQENTGINPTTTGGQTIGLLLDQSQGAVLGPELVTNGTFDTDLTGWNLFSTNATNTISWESGGLRLVSDGSTTLRFSQTILTVGRCYRISLTIREVTGAGLKLVPPSSEVNIAAAAGTYTYNAIADSTAVQISRKNVGQASNVLIDNISVREILGNHATQSTAANRPTYQLDSNGLPLARHDATDSLVVSLPSINVRRNLLTWSEQFDNSYWIKDNATVLSNVVASPINTGTANAVLETSATGTHNIKTTNSITGTPAGTRYVQSIYVKANGRTKIWLYDNSGSSVTFHDLTEATSSVVGGNVYSHSTENVGNGWFRCTRGGATNASGNASPSIRLLDASGNNSYAGDTSKGIYVWGAQTELGSVATDYQKITDWTSEAYSSSGSVYFATPQGMSALHNQSMGTSYTLPALSTDIYSWIVVPQRLSTVLENRLARYMERKAGIAGPDYLLDSSDNQLTADDGTELLLRA